VEARGIEPLTS